jgi:hypothetical protein
VITVGQAIIFCHVSFFNGKFWQFGKENFDSFEK